MTGPSYDRVVAMGRSRIQHGKANDRVYLMHLEPGDTADLLPRLDALAIRHGYSKIFAKAPVSALPAFLHAGYREEARVPRFFSGKKDCAFLGKYFDPARARDTRATRRREVLEAALARAADPSKRPARQLPASFSWNLAGPADANELARLYQSVFETYPFPIHDPAFIRQSMKDQTVYGCIRHRGAIAAVSSAEKIESEGAAEMTDFATLPDHRGRGLAQVLLRRMEDAMARQGVRTAYTIARAVSAPMNKTFASMNYRYGGTLINNTQICGRLESMNVWYKSLH